METLKVGYSKTWGWGIMIAGFVLFLMNFYLFTISSRASMTQMALCLFLSFSGALYLSRSYFELKRNELIVYALIGPMKRRYSFSNINEFVFEGDKLYHIRDGKRKRVWVGKLMSDKEAWREFETRIRRADFGGELHDLD